MIQFIIKNCILIILIIILIVKIAFMFLDAKGKDRNIKLAIHALKTSSYKNEYSIRYAINVLEEWKEKDAVRRIKK